GRHREALRAFGLRGERAAEQGAAHAREDPAGVARRNHRGLGRDVVPFRATELAPGRDDSHVAVARAATLLRDELFQAGNVSPLRVRIHAYERRAGPLNSVSTNGPADSTAAQRCA